MGRGTGREGDGNYIQNIIARNLIFRSKCAKNVLQPGYARPAGESKRFLRRIKPLASREWNTPHTLALGKGHFAGWMKGKWDREVRRFENIFINIIARYFIFM